MDKQDAINMASEDLRYAAMMFVRAWYYYTFVMDTDEDASWKMKSYEESWSQFLEQANYWLKIAHGADSRPS